MKYIRTKNGEIVSLVNNDYDINARGDIVLENNEYVPYEDILEIANTIEELCDEAIFFDKDNKPHYKSQEGNIWYLGASLFTKTLRFGVFTDKGLIYVAKMNDKGELELL